jgi:hypothetical protein
MKIGGFFIALALALTACSGDPEPRSPSPTTPPSATSTATPPAMPAQASEDSPEGAAAFASFWIESLDHALATGSTDVLAQASADECDGCQAYIKLVKSTYSAGGYIRGSTWSPGRFEIDYGDPETFMTTTVTIAAGVSRRSSETDEVKDPADSAELNFGATYDSSRWTMTQLALGDSK